MRVKWVIVALVGLLGALGLWSAGRSAYLELRSDFFADRVPIPNSVPRELDGGRAVEFRAASAVLSGWYVPPKNGAVIVLVHGTGGSRLSMLPDAELLSKAGFGALLFDWPGCGRSSGRTTWGEGERAALSAAIDFAAQQPDVQAGRLGVLAFSMGTLPAIQVSADDLRVRALVVTGAFGDPDRALSFQFENYGPLGSWAAVWSAHLAGMDLDGRRPQDRVARISPRPLLIVAGSADDIIPQVNPRALFAAAREPKALWMIEGAHHGEYAEVAGAEYDARIRAFFQKALLGAEVP